MKTFYAAGLLLAGSLFVGAAAQAAEPIRGSEGISLYVGIDRLNTLTSGTYVGLANPNAARLTFLYDHFDHFHSIGSYSYSGPASAPVINSTNANNRLPEPYTRISPAHSAIPMTAGTGAFTGMWSTAVMAAPTPAYEYSFLGIASIQSLTSQGAAGNVLFNSSGGRWSGSFADVTVGLKLVSISDGLKVASGSTMDVFAGGVGSVLTLGGSGNLLMMPTFYANGAALPGTYSAQFSLVNLGSNATVLDGGNFHFDMAVPVPEPSTWALMLAGLAVALRVASRRKSAG